MKSSYFILHNLLRIIGLVFLGGALIAELWWWNTEKIMNPVSEKVILSIDKTISLSFIPNQEVPERHYTFRLYFDNN